VHVLLSRLQVNYLYRLSDLELDNILGSSGHGPQNSEALCGALVTLGIVDSVAAGQKLIKKRAMGTSKASRLLNRFVSVCCSSAALLLCWHR
jgi:hypothetical protein